MRKSFLRLNRRRDSNQPASEEQSKEPVVHYDSGHEHMDESRGPLLRTQSVSNIHPQHSIEYRRHSNPVRGTSEAAVFQHLHGSLNGYKQTLHSGRGSLSSSPAAELPVHSSIVNPLAGGPFVAAMAEEKDGGYSLASGIRSARGSLVFQTPPAMNQGITPATPPPTSVDQALNHNGSDLSTYTRSRASSSVSQTPKPISTPASRISRTPLTKSKSTIGKGSADKLKAAGEKTDSVYSPDISRLVTTSAPRNGIPVATVNLTTVGTSYKKVSNNAHSDR